MFVQASVKFNSFLSSLVSCSLCLCPCIDSSDILKYSSCCERRQVLSTGLQTLWMWIHNNCTSRFKLRFSNYSFLLWTHLFFHLHLILVKKEFLLKFMECQYSCTIIFLVIFYFTLHSIQAPNPIYICSDSWPLNAPLHCRSCAWSFQLVHVLLMTIQYLFCCTFGLHPLCCYSSKMLLFDLMRSCCALPKAPSWSHHESLRHVHYLIYQLGDFPIHVKLLQLHYGLQTL